MRDPFEYDRVPASGKASWALRLLWILGAGVTIASVVGLAWSLAQLTSDAGARGGGLVLTQMLYSLCPATLTAGLVFVGLALALTAAKDLIPTARGGDPTPELQPDLEVADHPAASIFPGTNHDPAPASSSPAPAPRGSRPLDPEAFKRPLADKHPAT